MVKYLLKTVETYRLEALCDVKQFHEDVLSDATMQRYMVTGFSYKEKTSKDDQFYEVSVTKQFNEAKDPDLPLKEITYTTYAELLEDEMEDIDFE